jgi:hypothetical protein
VLADPQMPAMSTVLDQAHNAIDRHLFAMKGCHHPGGSQAALLTGLAHLYNLIPYQRRCEFHELMRLREPTIKHLQPYFTLKIATGDIICCDRVDFYTN